MGKQEISLKKNFLMNMLLTMSAFLFPLITFPYVSRILGPIGTGKVTLANSWVTYFNLFAQLGIPTYGVRICAQVRDDKKELSRTVQELTIINLVMGILAYAVFFGMLLTSPKMSAEKPLYLVMSSMILFNAIGMEWLYRGLEQYTYITKRSVLFKLIALIGMFLMVRSKEQYVIYGALTIFAASASNILNFFYAHHYIQIRPTGGYHFLRHWKPVTLFFAMACATTIYTNLDVVMLGHMKADIDVGYYNAAVKIKGIVVSMVTSLGTVLLPRASYYVEHKMMEQFWKISQKALQFVCLFALPTVVYFILFAREGILLLSGPKFYDAIPSMQIIMPTVFFIGITNILGIQILIPLGKEHIVLYSVIFGAVIDLVINWRFIPAYGAAGASFGTLIAEFAVLMFQVAALRICRLPLHLPEGLWKVTGALLISASAAGMIRLLISSCSDFIILVIGGIVLFGIYGSLLLAFKEKMMLEIIRQMAARFYKRKRKGGA